MTNPNFEMPDLRTFTTLSPKEQEEVKRQLAPFVTAVLPTEPGRYLDNQGHSWTLNADNTWSDRYGTSKPETENWILAVVAAPFSLDK